MSVMTSMLQLKYTTKAENKLKITFKETFWKQVIKEPYQNWIIIKNYFVHKWSVDVILEHGGCNWKTNILSAFSFKNEILNFFK